MSQCYGFIVKHETKKFNKSLKNWSSSLIENFYGMHKNINLHIFSFFVIFFFYESMLLFSILHQFKLFIVLQKKRNFNLQNPFLPTSISDQT